MKLMEPQLVKRIVEAALLAANQPMALSQITALFGDGEPVGSEAVAQALEELKADCEGRGVELVEVASGFRYQVRQDVHPWVARMWTERQTKYSRALLETLALIAYRQPITRAEIEQIRGVVVSSSIIRTLEEREWVRVVGHRDVPGRPALFGTTRQFLDYFNLKSLDELPPLAEIRDLEDLEPQLPLADGERIAPPPVAADAQAANEPQDSAAETFPAKHADPAGASPDAAVSDANRPDPPDVDAATGLTDPLVAAGAIAAESEPEPESTAAAAAGAPSHPTGNRA
jgi:segregation and condensation protein B